MARRWHPVWHVADMDVVVREHWTVLKTDDTKTHAALRILTRGKYLGNFVVK